MAKIEKHAEFMDLLHGMITKEATAGKATGKPGADTHYTSVSKETEHVDKNKEGHPEHNPQEFKQEKAKDESDPTKTHKAAEEVKPGETPVKEAAVAPQSVSTAPAKPGVDAPNKIEQTVKKAEEGGTNEKLAQLGQQLLDTINEMNKNATAGTATGVPGKDTHYTSVSKETEHVDKNKEGHPEHNPQEFKQEKAKDSSDPTKHSKKAEDEELELDKEASFQLGRNFARAFLASKTAESNIYKEAGRRDFEALIAQASAELEAEAPKKNKHMKPMEAPVKEAEANDEELQIKQAEEAGAQAFYALVKQAQEEEKANQIKLAFDNQINTLLAEKAKAEKTAAELAHKLAARDAEIQKQAEEAKLDAKFAAWGGRVVEEVISRLKSETVK